MPKRVSEKEKTKIIKSFKNGKTIDELSKKFNCTKITISRYLKNNIDESEYKNLLKQNKLNKNKSETDKFNGITKNKNSWEENDVDNKSSEILSSDASFIEIAPLNYEIDNLPQKDLSSLPISEINFPKVVYMVVDKKIELETKYLKEYPDWQFLSEQELNRKTIQIFEDLKNARRFCNQEQKVIKVPNTEVFKLVAPLLLSRGISRIVSDNKLIAL